MRQLLAKSCDNENSQNNAGSCTLRFHLRLTFTAAKIICELTGRRQLEAIGFDPKVYFDRFKKILLLSAFIHDLGKANSHFYAMVNKENEYQSIRHEWVLYLLLRFSRLGTWLKRSFSQENREKDFNCLVWAITGHHRKKRGTEINETGQDMELLIDPDKYDFFDILNEIAETAEFDLPPIDFNYLDLLSAPIPSLENIQDFIASPGGQDFRNNLEDLCFETEPNGEDDTLYISSSFMASIRSSLMAADAAASAMGEGYPQDDAESCLSQWICDHLKDLPTVEKFQKIAERKQAELKNGTSDKLAPSRQKFQNETAQSKARITLCIAGCGSGKTFAAWKWALNNCRQDGNRLFFCYPTTGTASEGFMDYLTDQGDLIHSRSEADYELLDRLRKNKKVNPKKTEDPFDIDSIMRSLEFWRSSVACCTVDTVLKMLTGGYSGHLIWPVMAQSSFIFDEIHSYDETLFERLLQFLKNIKGVKVLLLTASLPEDRLKKLCRLAKRNKINESSKEINIIKGPREWETIRRYRQMKSEQDPVDLIIDRYRKGQKILWICNTVDRAIKAREKVIQRLNEIDNSPNRSDDNIIIYHSRFKYADRIKRHEACMKAFKNEGPVLCIATQVAEMSLDISADFLVTDAAPIPALIQRLGRLNRRALFDDPKPFLVIDPKNEEGKRLTLPYSVHDDSWLNAASEWLNRLAEEPLSQIDLTEKWGKLGKTGLETDQANTDLSWNAPGPWMNESNLRDASSGCNVLLKEDLNAVKMKGPKEYIEKVIPMPQPFKISNNLEKWSKYGCYVAEKGVCIEYDEKVGGRWISSENKEEKESPDGIKEILIF